MSLVQLARKKYDHATLAQRQSLPLDAKIAMAKARIREWAERWDDEVFVAFSGGKDSSVLLHLVRSTLGDEVPAVFYDTGLEFPELKEHVRRQKNVVIRRPRMSYRQVIDKYGWPVVSKKVSHQLRAINNASDKNATVRNFYLTGYTSKGTFNRRFLLPQKWRFLVDAPFRISDRCCDVMKKQPAYKYEKETGRKPFVGELAEESAFRTESWLTYGCNAFDTNHPKSTPLATWTEQDVLRYIQRFKLDVPSVYGHLVETVDPVTGASTLAFTGEQRTGCVWCLYGAEYPGPDGLTRFQRLAITHPKIWRYCIEDMGMAEVLDFLGIEYRPPMDEELARMLA